MKSELFMDEVIFNKDRKFGSARYYFPCKVTNAKGEEKPAMFSGSQIKLAIARADKNPEDFPQETKSFWKRLFGGA